MLNWQVGAVKITCVVETVIPFPNGSLLPDATEESLKSSPWLFPHFAKEDGTLFAAAQAMLVEAPGLRLLVDTCVGNDKPRHMLGDKAQTTPFLQHLADLGWDRERVDIVLCTHLHVDHVGWNTMLVDGKWIPTFPNARYLIGKREFEHWSHEGDEEQRDMMVDSVRPIFDAGLVDLVEMNHRIAPEVRLMPSAGHTPGHVSVMIESGGQRAVITGDVAHHPCQMAHPEWSTSFDSDREAALSTRLRMFKEWADKPVLVIGTHYVAPTAGHVKRDGAVFRFEV
ncbi:MAG TPA: MBL fold metallo-hydrolase [Candidatus Sulfotelmatobacter sp.]|nr:MBL fold metallo-hydrolase [Candidatus Sulfotelmatobacter sp.]